MRLIASWPNGKHPSSDVPTSIRWEDGRQGTPADLHAHNCDTYCLTHLANGATQMDIFPEIVGVVSYCDHGKRWGIKGDGVEAIALPIADRNATDQQIHAALYTLPMKYRVVIRR